MGTPQSLFNKNNYKKRGAYFYLRTRDIKRQFWLNEEENKKLKENAKKVGLTESSYVRNLINGYKPKEQPNELFYEMLKQLKGIGINLNQIAKKANALDFIDVPHYERTCRKLNEFIEKIKKEFMDMN
jgi:hypothetical protein